AMGERGQGSLVPIYGFGQTTTVFDLAWRTYGEGRLPVWGSILAQSQTKGRGRAGRPWCSPQGHVYAALRLPEAAPFDAPSASIGLALLISMALEELFSLKTLIKWPNDIVLERKKVGGLLLEARRGAIIGGIGLNLISPPVWAPKEPGLDRDKVSGPRRGQAEPYLAPLEAGALPIFEGPDKLWTKLVDKMRVCYNIIMARSDHPPVGTLTPMDLATTRLLGLGQKVAILSPSTEPPFPGRVLTGVLIGLDASGALLIDQDQTTYAVWSGSLFFEFLS
ncbi:MAG: hypothetical protein LBF38_01490, partial [Deltaproteobacteria bacterium]|nr:hypothetical protein [Deltaproteobacteria bacterium]